jgi:hypothetical protein
MSRSSITLLSKPPVRILFALTIVTSLLLIPYVPFVQRSGAQSLQERSEDQRREGNPKPGKPEATLANLDTVRSQRPVERELPAPIPSTMRSRKNAEKPWNGRRVAEEQRQLNDQSQNENPSAVSTLRRANDELRKRQVRRAHVRTRVNAAPPSITEETSLTSSNLLAPAGTTLVRNSRIYPFRPSMKLQHRPTVRMLRKRCLVLTD